MNNIFIIIFLLCSPAVFAQDTDNGDKNKVIAIVNRFFEALEKKDTVLYRSLVMRNAQIWVTRKHNDTLQTPMRSFADDMKQLPSFRETLYEKPISCEVNLHRNIATVWAPYTFHLGHKLTHCGIDVFTLLRTTEGWKIVSAVYSVEPDACAELQKNTQ